MNDISPKEAKEILSHYTNLGYGIIIEGDDISKIIQALSLASKTLANGTSYNTSRDCISRSDLKKEVVGMMINKADDLEEVEFEINATLASVCEKIDNAQAVPLPNEQIAWEQGYEAGLAQGKHDRLQSEYIRKEDVIALLNKWADGYSYIEIPTEDAIKAILEFNPKGGTE